MHGFAALAHRHRLAEEAKDRRFARLMAHDHNLRRRRGQAARSEEDYMPTAAPTEPETLREKISRTFGAPQVA